MALSLVGYLVAFHVFDALQGISAFVLRAYKIAVAPMVIYALSLWGVHKEALLRWYPLENWIPSCGTSGTRLGGESLKESSRFGLKIGSDLALSG